MRFIRTNIKIVVLITIWLQISILLFSIAHNHTQHYLKLFPNELIDQKDNHSHNDPFSDESGFCRINDYIRTSLSVTLSDQTSQTPINRSVSDLLIDYNNHYQYFLNHSSPLRGPPSA